MRAALVMVIVAGVAGWSVSCVDRMPDQDRRILTAVPVAKMSADILWKDYQTNATQARRMYFRQPIVISGVVTSVGTDAPGDRFLMFGQTEKNGVRANLLDEQAADLLKSVPPDKRVTLKCFCEGLKGDVILKSCVKP